MYPLEFEQVFDYSGEGESVVIPVLLRSGSNEIQIAASIDTGASFCLFATEIAAALGLDLTSGMHERFRTANSRFDAFGRDVELQVLGVLTHSLIYFFADPTIDKNVLGRGGWLHRVRFGLIHHDSKIYLAPHDPS